MKPLVSKQVGASFAFIASSTKLIVPYIYSTLCLRWLELADVVLHLQIPESSQDVSPAVVCCMTMHSPRRHIEHRKTNANNPRGCNERRKLNVNSPRGYNEHSEV